MKRRKLITEPTTQSEAVATMAAAVAAAARSELVFDQWNFVIL
ncbi:MAG TPA: hypothetical protein VM735_05400 [Candidatus Kapabacteria bacterium]|nr:hypothetical protein [Candidatus Kapabacteria bacterium]